MAAHSESDANSGAVIGSDKSSVQSTIISLMALELNSDMECCYDYSFSEDLLQKCKKATSSSLNQSQEDQDKCL